MVETLWQCQGLISPATAALLNLEKSHQECKDCLALAQEALAALEQSSELTLFNTWDMIAAMTTEDGAAMW